MLQLPTQTRDSIVRLIAESNLPINVGLQIINALNSLGEVEQEKAKEASEKKK